MQTTTVDERSAVHACAVPGSDEQLWEMSARFLAAGLTARRAGRLLRRRHRRRRARTAGRRPRAGRTARSRTASSPSSRRRRPARVLRGTVRDAAVMLAARIDRAVADRLPGLPDDRPVQLGLSRRDGVGARRFRRRLSTPCSPGARPACSASTTATATPTTPSSGCARSTGSRSTPPRSTTTTCCASPARRPFRIRLAGEVDHSNRPVVARMVAATLDEALRVRRRACRARVRPVVAAVPRRRGRGGPGTRGRGVPRVAPARAAEGAARGAAGPRPLRRAVRRPARRHRASGRRRGSAARAGGAAPGRGAAHAREARMR